MNRTSFLLVLVGMVLSMSCHANADATCPDGWMAFKAKCYKAFTGNHLEWGTAENFCVGQGQGGHLASVGSPEESNIVESLVDGFDLSRKGGFWIGGNDIAAESTWAWSDGSEWKWYEWNSGEPNGGSAQDCVLMNNDHGWVDEYCHAKYSFVCEIKSLV